jgi:hypothetical protein
MTSVILSACLLAAVTVAVHAGGIAALLWGMMKLESLRPTSVWPIIQMLLRMLWWLVLIHLLAILIWGLFYWSSGCVPDFETSFYFSGTTYTTIGYGDVVLAKPWRFLAPLEGLLGVLMCGLSAGLLFAALSQVYHSRHAKSSGR